MLKIPQRFLFCAYCGETIEKRRLDEIPFEDRNFNKVLVLAEQMLDVGHGPTKTAAEFFQMLDRSMNESMRWVIWGRGGKCRSMHCVGQRFCWIQRQNLSALLMK